MRHLWLLIGIFGCAAIGFGAFGAHGLDGADAVGRAAYETAVRYHLFHVLAAALALSLAERAGRIAPVTAALFLASVVCFSGSIYLDRLAGISMPVAPVGGIGFMIAWLMLGLGGWRWAASRRHEKGDNGASDGI